VAVGAPGWGFAGAERFQRDGFSAAARDLACCQPICTRGFGDGARVAGYGEGGS
jgi:hypothetical protein